MNDRANLIAANDLIESLLDSISEEELEVNRTGFLLLDRISGRLLARLDEAVD